MSTPFDTLTALRDEWQALQPLSAENEARLWKKLRLEWNYHSNHIEGNTLTYGETELLLLHDRTTGNHSHREYLEMKAHDVGIEHVRTLAEDQTRLLTEGDIRDLNKIILKEPFWKAAETADGQPTRKEIVPGQYKTTPNNVRLPNGDIFFFVSVEDTPPRMSALAAWLRQELESPTLHPVAFAAKLHHDFVLIHPFDDGNGRVARLLVNYVLMRSGYLPLIVRTEDKANYLTALHLADAGELSAIISYFHQLTEWSLNLGIKAAKGEAIEEPSDVEKEVQLFIRDQKARSQGAEAVDKAGLQHALNLSIIPLLRTIEAKLLQLRPLFESYEIHFQRTRDEKPMPPTVIPGHTIPYASMRICEPGDEIRLRFAFRRYTTPSRLPFDYHTFIYLHLAPAQLVLIHNEEAVLTRPYTHVITTEEADAISAKILSACFNQIKQQAALPS